jgi:hypothetical protein
MNRKDFLKRLAFGAAGAVVAPQVIAEVAKKPVLSIDMASGGSFTAITKMSPPFPPGGYIESDFIGRSAELRVEYQVLNEKLKEQADLMKDRFQKLMEKYDDRDQALVPHSIEYPSSWSIKSEVHQ